MKKLLLFAAVSVLALSSCKKDKDEKKSEKVFKSEVKIFQHGKAWTWYEEDDSRNPVRVAIAIDDAAMNSLDRGGDQHGGGGHHHDNTVSIAFHPKAAAATPFKHALLEWMPAGHQPFFGKPHFDLHFYMTSEAERLAIPTFNQDPTKFENYPGQDYMAPSYVPVPGGVPQMGTHWIDVTDPAITSASFTQTFIYGSYDGKVTFYEPMITEDFIKNNATFERTIPQPVKYQVSGWHPTKMRMEKKNGVTSIILEGFVKRQAS